MEPLSFKLYIEKIFIENFTYFSFSPENCGKLYDLFRKIFYQESPFWREGEIEGNVLYVEFKKYGKNRKRVFLKFSFLSNSKNPRELALSLVNEELDIIDEMSVEISLASIWRNHEILITQLKKYVELGLNLAEEVN